MPAGKPDVNKLALNWKPSDFPVGPCIYATKYLPDFMQTPVTQENRDTAKETYKVIVASSLKLLNRIDS
jgi:hypothetical protein